MIDIRSLPSVSGDVLRGVDLLGLKTVEGFLSLMQIHESREAFKKMVGLSESALGRSIQQLRDHLPKSCGAMHPSPVMPVQLGLSWGHVEASYPANYFGSMAHDSSEEEVDLIPQLPPVRNQWRRGTCVAFAATAAFEHEMRRNALFGIGNVLAFTRTRSGRKIFRRFDEEAKMLSPQFLYWACKSTDGVDGPGTMISTAMESLRDRGCCQEKGWPYSPDSQWGNEGQGPPPFGAEESARKRRITEYDELTCFGSVPLQHMKRFLAQGHLLVFGVPVFPSWGNIETQQTGRVIMPISGEQSLGGHALCLCGYRDDGSCPGGGVFYFRNSWGEEWASQNTRGRGYGEMPYAYMQMYARDVYAMRYEATGLLNFPVAAVRAAIEPGVAFIKSAAMVMLTVAIMSMGSLVAWQFGRAVQLPTAEPQKDTQQPVEQLYSAAMEPKEEGTSSEERVGENEEMLSTNNVYILNILEDVKNILNR